MFFIAWINEYHLRFSKRNFLLELVIHPHDEITSIKKVGFSTNSVFPLIF